MQILASGTTPGILGPGETARVPVYYAGMQEPFSHDPTLQFSLQAFHVTNPDPVDWSALKESLQPPNMTAEAWNAIYTGLTNQLGDTWGGYVRQLADTAAYLGRLGQTALDVGDLWEFAILQADGLSPVSTLAAATDISIATPGLSLSFGRTNGQMIDSRFKSGRLGYGWYDNWQYSLTKLGDGTVLVRTPSGYNRIFQPDSRNSNYFNEVGDFGTLRADVGGTFTLQETDGTTTHFNSNGTIDYVQDTNAIRITAGYSAGRLTSLTHSAGQSLTLAYNSGGKIQSVTASDGRVIQYGYDASNKHLIFEQSYDGRTISYSYNTTAGTASEHALAAIAYPDGTHQIFTYDNSGRLIGSAHDGGANAITFSYDQGRVTATDAAGAASQYFFDTSGLIVKTVDPLGNASFVDYDEDFQVASIIGPTGLTSNMTYDSRGNPMRVTDPLGHSVNFTYTVANNRLVSMTNAQVSLPTISMMRGAILPRPFTLITLLTKHHSTPVAIRSQLPTRMGKRSALRTTQRGSPSRRTFANGFVTTYAYDTRGNLTSAIDAAGTTALTYDTGDRLTKVTYPNGLFLQYSYDAAGRRIQIVDQAGAATNYAYDTLGRLRQLTDESANSLVVYTYDSRGSLAREDKGNGTYTTYEYDAAGQLLHLVNHAPGGAVNSRFDYTYDALGQRISMSSLDGVWAYIYDGTGQLIQADFISSNSAIQDRHLTYSYDASGNRITTSDNSVVRVYATNVRNQYTSVTDPNGTTTYEYDNEGNLVAKNDSSDRTNFTYDPLNRLIAIATGADAYTYEYNSLDFRSATVTNRVRTEALFDPLGLGSLVGSYAQDGSPISNSVFGIGLVATSTADGRFYFDYDAIGSTAGMSAGNGLYHTIYAYLPFGESLNSTGAMANPVQFVGRWGVSAEAIGTDLMRFRTYDSSLGRFLQLDSSGLTAGDVNFYRYVVNSPGNAIDPSGLEQIRIPLGPNSWVQIDLEAPGLGDLLPSPPVQIGRNPNQGETVAGVGASPNIFGIPLGTGKIGYGERPIISPDFNGPPTPLRPLLYPGPYRPDSPPAPESPSPPGGPGGPSGQGPGGPGGAPTPTPPPTEGPAPEGTPSAKSKDPNELLGPGGYGDKRFVSGIATLPYEIHFENFETATAPLSV